MDNVIITKELQVERKHFFIEFRENERGRFMRITEEAHGRRNTIIIPSTGLEEFMAMAGEVMQVRTAFLRRTVDLADARLRREALCVPG